MIKDVMVWLEGGISDEIRLAAVAEIARRLGSEVVIRLFLNPLPLPGPVDGDISGALAMAELMTRAREVGDKTEALLPGDSHNLSGQSRFGGSMCGLTTSPILLPARRVPPIPLWRCVPTARWIPNGWSKAFSWDRAGTSSWFPRRSDQRSPSIVSSSPGTQPGVGPSLGRSPAISKQGE
jgi:hypothetical protein